MIKPLRLYKKHKRMKELNNEKNLFVSFDVFNFRNFCAGNRSRAN